MAGFEPDPSGWFYPILDTWQQECQNWSQRSLEGKRYIYVWSDGIHLDIRPEDMASASRVLNEILEVRENE